MAHICVPKIRPPFCCLTADPRWRTLWGMRTRTFGSPEPERRFKKPKPVKRKLVVRFSVELRERLDQIGTALGMVHKETGRPRDTELVRLLLVCGLLGPEASPLTRSSIAVYVNSEIVLASALGSIGALLRGQVIASSASAAIAALERSNDLNRYVSDLHQSLAQLAPRPPLVGSRLPRPRHAKDKDGRDIVLLPDRTRVNLVLDDWMFRVLSRRAAESPVADRAPRSLGSEAVRQLLQAAVDDFGNHLEACAAYLAAVEKLRAAIETATQAGQEAISVALQDV